MTEVTSTTQPSAEIKEKPGKTFADVLDSILNDKRKFWSVLGMSIVIIVLSVVGIGGLIWLFGAFFGLSPSQVEVNTLGNQITLTTTSGRKKSTLIMVHPQGWENTKIPVHKGQSVIFHAEGKVSIDGYSLVKAWKLLGDLEDHYGPLVRKANSRLRDDKQTTPEQYYSKGMRDILNKCLRRLWTEPEGFDAKYYLGKYPIGECPDFSKLDPDKDPNDRPAAHPDISYDYPDQDFPGRTQHKVMPNEPYGKLIGAVRTEEN